MGLNWFQKRMLGLSLALSNVEKNALGQSGEMLTNDTTNEQSVNQGTLAQSLKRGEVTHEVQMLRARMYKIYEEMGSWSYKGDQDKDTKGFKHDKREKVPSNIKGEPSDDKNIELLFYNIAVKQSVVDALGSINEEDNEYVNIKSEIDPDITTIGHLKNVKTQEQFPLIIGREITPKFYIESFTKELYVKTIDEENKLLEFFISAYKDIEDDRTTFLIKEIEKAIENPRHSSLLDITDVGFLTNSTLGKKDNHLFEYKITSFDKIVKFNGNYVIKFNAKVVKDGIDTLEKYKMEELNEKYVKKEKK